MAAVLISLGSNLGDRTTTLTESLRLLASEPGIEGLVASSFYPSSPIGGPVGQSEFLNAVARADTSLSPGALLGLLQKIESQLGRKRDVRWGPRTIDLDLLLYDERVEHSEALELPHPRMATRRFVLEPAVEIAPDLIHPTIGWSMAQLLSHLRRHPPYVALAGPTGAGKTSLARELAGPIGARANLSIQCIEEPVDDVYLTRFYANPTGLAWETELEFLRTRAGLLQGIRPENAHWCVSDFWFDQGLAYGSLWLSPDLQSQLVEQYAATAPRVPRPKLLVVLDASATQLQQRIAGRGRKYEQTLDIEQIEHLRRAIDSLSRRPGLGPVLHLSTESPSEVLSEVLAAIASMQ